MNQSMNQSWEVYLVSPRRFCRRRSHHHQLGKGERAWDRKDHARNTLPNLLLTLPNIYAKQFTGKLRCCKYVLIKINDYQNNE